MHTEVFYVLGAGGHAKVVMDALFSKGLPPEHVRLLDNNPLLDGQGVMDVIVKAPFLFKELHGTRVHIAIGNNHVRERMYESMMQHGALFSQVTHPDASISQHAKIDEGAFVAAQAVVAPLAHIGKGSIINHGAVIDHDCNIEDFCHIAPGATLAGAVRVGKRVLIGAGANILPGIHIADDAVIGAGAVVTQDVPPGQIWVGVPATQLARK